MTNPDEPVGISAGELQHQAARGSFWTAANALLSVPVAFVANAVVARVLGITDYGRLAFLTLALALAVQVTNFGVSDAVVRWGAVSHTRGARGDVDVLLRKSLGFHLLVQLPLLVVTVLVLAHDSGPLVLAALLLSVAAPAALGSAALSLTIENRMAASAKLAFTAGVIGQVVLAVTAVVAKSPTAVWASRSVAASVLLPLNVVLLDAARRRVVIRASLPRDMPRGFWRYAAFSVAGAIVGTLVFSRSELLALAWLSDAASLGAFALAFGLSQQLVAPVEALIGPLQPAVAGLVAAHPLRAQSALMRATRFAAVLSALLTGAAVPALYFLIPVLYGGDFKRAALLFLPLAGVACMYAIVRPLTVFIQARGRSDVLLGVYVKALGVDVLCALALIPPFGAWGAVLANAAGQLTALLLACHDELSHLTLPARDFFAGVVIWCVSVLIAVAVVALVALAPLPALVQALVAFGFGLTVLVAVARVLPRPLDDADAAALLPALPRVVRLPTSFGLRLLGVRTSA